jgi:hypothetical protein
LNLGRRSQLRVSHVWRGEVMADRIMAEAQPVTLGPTHQATFTTPDLGLPARFAVLRPGQRGWLLTLGEGMTGRARLGGKEIDVAEFLARGGGERAEGQAGAFRATAVGPGDWGVIHLDRTGDHELFFHFVAEDPPIPGPSWRDHELLRPAFAFSAIIHAILLAITFYFQSDAHTLMFPGGTEIVAGYLVSHPPEQVEPLHIEEVKAGVEDGEKDAPPASTAGEAGKAGGEGKKPRARAPDPDQGSPTDAVRERVMETGALRHRDKLEVVLKRGGFDRRLGTAAARLQGARNDGGPGGYGSGKGTGVGPGEGTGTLLRGGNGGPGGGGTAHADVITQGAIKTGGTRPPRGTPGGGGVKEAEVSVKTGTATGDFGDLSAEEINRVVMSRKNAIRACYERELNHRKDLSGKIVVSWRIDAGGAVQGARIKSSDLRSGEVEDCVVRQIQRLQFPKPRGGTTALVNYPFIFAQR